MAWCEWRRLGRALEVGPVRRMRADEAAGRAYTRADMDQAMRYEGVRASLAREWGL